MNIGGIDFSLVWAYQIKCMMANQYDTLTQAIKDNDKNKVILACLRLGWNDAFKHVSKNRDDDEIKKKSDTDKAELILDICKNLIPYFETYAKKTTTKERIEKLTKLSEDEAFRSIIGRFKDVDAEGKKLCVGHIQKMFNIAIKLILCLIISAHHAAQTSTSPLLHKDSERIVTLDDKLLSLENFPYAFETADCPIDSIILSAVEQHPELAHVSLKEEDSIKFKSVVWSHIGADEKNPTSCYTATHHAIAQIQEKNSPTLKKINLCYDFENWNSSKK